MTLVIRPLGGGRRKEGKIVYKYVEEEEEEEKEVVPLKRLNYYHVDIFFYFFSHFLSLFFVSFRYGSPCSDLTETVDCKKNSNTTRKEKNKQNAAVSFPPISHNQPFFFTIVVFPQHLERKNELTD